MTVRVEREFKLRLPDEAALAALRSKLDGGDASTSSQVNHFFDTAARALRKAAIALRLRAEDGVHTLALKGPALTGSGALASRPEEELVLDAANAAAVLDGARSPLAFFAESPRAEAALVRAARAAAGDAPLLHLGAFENERTRVGPLRFPPGTSGAALVFELDRTRFPGGIVERELEVELPPAADASTVEAGLRALFAELGIAFTPASNKAARFFARLDVGH